MSRLGLALCTWSSCWCAAFAGANAQDQALERAGPKDLTAHFDVQDGIAVELWAESPDFYNPTAIDIDAKGRVFVAEAVNYRQWEGRNPGLKRPEGDRIVVLEDTDGDGKCDKSTVFAQDKDLVAPLGVCVLPDGEHGEKRIMVSCSPTAWIYTDKDNDGKSDSKDVFLTGFGGHDHDHGLHSFVVAPDGRYWFAVGNAGPHIVTDKCGFHLRSGSLYRGGGEFETDNAPGLVSDDGRVWTGGLICSIDPNGTNLQVMAHNFRNEYEVALDSFGRFYTEDNDDDGNQACRTVRCLEGGNHGYFSADGSRYWNADKRPGQDVQTAHWHSDDPGVVPAGTINGAGGPTGVCVYECNVLGDYLKGCVLDADAGRNCVWVHKPNENGCGCTFVPSTLIAARTDADAEKDASWFRPSDVCVASDGSVFVSDWSDPGVGGHLLGDRKAYGRILRLRPTDRRRLRPATNMSTDEGRGLALDSPNIAERSAAFAGLPTDGSGIPLQSGITTSDVLEKGRYLFSLCAQSAPGARGIAFTSLKDKDSRIRALALRLLRAHRMTQSIEDPAEHTMLFTMSEDPSPEVRAELAITLRGSKDADAPKALVDIATRWDGDDRRYIEALGLGAEGKEAALWPLLLGEMGDPDPLAWSDKFCGIAWRLHPKEAIPGWIARANDADLTFDARKQAVDALAFTRDHATAEAVLNLAIAGPADTRAYAAWWIRNRDTNDWAEWKLARELGTDALEDAEMVASTGILTSGGRQLDVSIAGAKKLWLVATEGKKGQSCDWSDWLEPTLVTDHGDVALSSLPWSSAKAGWGDVHVGRNCNGGALIVDDRTHEDGIGTHALSTIAWDLPVGVQRLKVFAAVDDGGSKQPSHASDVEFQVWVDSGARRDRLKSLESALVDTASSADAVAKAADALCADRDGGLDVLHLAAEAKLTPAAKTAVAQRIFKNPDMSVRALASQHFDRPAANGAKMPSVAELAALKGDASRGTSVFFGKQANCASCHTFHGRGGDVGPDLTAVRSKYKAPELLDSILNPSAAIAFGYDAWLVETKDEELVSGFILSEGDSIVMKDTTGKRRVIPASEVVTKTKQKASLMPDNVALGLAPQDIADLVAFLMSDPTSPGKRGAPIELFDGRTLDGWTFFLAEPKAKMSDVWSVKDGVLRCKGQPLGYLRTVKDWTNYELDVDWRFDPAAGAGNSGVLLRVQAPDKVWPKSIESQLESRNAGDIWNIDDVPMQVDAARTEGRHTGKAQPCNEKPLGEWNHYHIVLDGGELTLEVNGVVQNRASWCEEVPGKIALQSEGAVIEFKKVTLTPIER
jgi:putative membrane-bound dehydrogenase-like protein